MKKILIFVIGLLISNIILSQAPGEIGNISGANGQPKLLFWLIADSTNVADGNNVSTWKDVSGNGYEFQQSNSTYQPTYTANSINNHGVVSFSTASQTKTERLVLNPFNNMASDQLTVFVVMNTSSSGEAVLSYAMSSSNSNEYLLFDQSNLRTYINNSAYISNVDFTGNPTILSENWSNTNGTVNIFKNGSSSASGTLKKGYSINSGGSLVIGGEQDDVDGGYDNNQALDGDIAEMIFYSTKLNNAQRTIVENYLSAKYNISINNDKYTGNDAAYIYNLTGIGQESDGNQLSSSSAGFYVTAPTSTLDDGDYILFAHNNAPNSSSDINTTTDLPSGVQAAWNRVWYLEKTGNTDATIAFDIKEGMTDGKYPANISNYVLLYRSSTTGTYSILKSGADAVNGSKVEFNLTDADIANGYYTLGTLDESASPVEGVDGRSWYTLASGNWDDWQIWTLDPSGALPNNPDHYTPSTSPTASADKVYILTGKEIIVNTNNKQNAELTVNGTVDFGTTTGNNFGKIKGNGYIKLAADNFPQGDATDFITEGQGEGTVIYYGNSYSLTKAREFYNVKIELDNPANVLTLLADYNINGKLSVNTGHLQINDNSSTTNLNITVKKDVVVNSNGFIQVGNANARHQFNFYGNFTNNGIVKFTNRTAPNYSSEATNGIVDANFLNATKNQSVLCNDSTIFYRIKINKGTDATYVLNLDASNPDYFKLYGYADESHPSTAQLSDNKNALGLVTGTVRIGSNINIPVLSIASNYNISQGASLWVDGGTLQKNSGNAIVPYGEVRITAGLLEAKVPSGITLRDNGLIKVEGGTINTNVIRTSVLGANNVGGYVQSGGTVNIVNASHSTSTYYHFSMTYPGNVFSMSGGILHVFDANGTNSNQGGIFIASDPENVNVTGGTIIAEIANLANTFKITCKANLWNLILRNTLDNTTDFLLDGGSNINNNSDADLPVQPLVILNDLTIEDNAFLDNNNQNITIGRNFYIARNAQKDVTGLKNNYGLAYAKSDTYHLIFNGKKSGLFTIDYNVDDGYELVVPYVYVDKASDTARIKLKAGPNKDADNVNTQWHCRILRVMDTMYVHKGIFDQNHQSSRMFGEVFVDAHGQLGVYKNGSTPRIAYIMFRDGDVTIHSQKGSTFGNIKFNSTGTVTFTSDVYIKRIGLYQGMYNIKTFNLKVDYLNYKETANNLAFNNANSSKMIYSDGNASDGGISIYIPKGTPDGTNFVLPLGTKANGVTRYTPIRITVSNVTDSGYIQVRPSDNILKTTNLDGSNILSYYWRVSFCGFSNNKPTVKYRFIYDDSDDDNNAEATFVAGKVMDIYPFKRTFEDDPTPDLNSVDENNNYIDFDGSGNGFTLDSACYTAGYYTRFQGQPDVYYTDASYKTWNTASIWHKNSKTGPTGEIPQEGSVAVIFRDNTSNSARIWGDDIPNTPAMVIFEIDRNVFPNVTTENQPRLQFRRGGTFNIGRVSGPGMISIEVSKNPNVIADWGDFAKDSCATLMYGWDSGQNDTLNNLPEQIPSLMFENNNFAINQELTVNYDLILNGTPNVTFLKDVLIKRDMIVGYWKGGTIHFPGSGDPVTVTVQGNIDFTRYKPDGTTRKITVDDPGSDLNLEHKLIVYGDIIQGDKDYMQLNLFNAQNRPAVILELAGDTSATYTRASASTPSLYKIIMNKGNNQNLFFRFADDFTLNGPTYGSDKDINLQNGSLILDDPNINIVASTGGGDFKIPASSALEIRQGKVTIKGTDAGLNLDGKLKISGGTLDMATATGNGNNYIQYSASGNATIEVSAGKLLVGSQIRRALTSDQGILKFIQTGGDVEIGADAATVNKRAIFEITNPGSYFSMSGGNFKIINDKRSNPSIASFYFDPQTAILSSGTAITIGDASSTNPNFKIYAAKPLENLDIVGNSTNPTKLTIDIVPLNLNENLNIGANSTLDANGLDILIKGDWNNNGDFIANQNQVVFDGTTDQTITGNTTFYKLLKNTSNTLYLDPSTQITIDNLLNLNSGIFNTQQGSAIVKGDLISNITCETNGTSDGIIMQGDKEQFITGNGVFDRLMINNINGVKVPTGNTETIIDSLILSKGVFNIGKNLLILSRDASIIPLNPFSTKNMIQTNISFTDAGVVKHFPEINSSTTFTYPVGSNGKYTPVTFKITKFAPDNASIRVKSADERHPSIIEDDEAPYPELVDSLNVLQYYWFLDGDGVQNFSAEATMQGVASDALCESPDYTLSDYITARLLYGSNLWDKYSTDDFNENTTELYFHFVNTDDKGIDGDYTAGVDGSSFKGAIPDSVPIYVSNQDGDWTNKDIWTPTSPAGGPRGAIVIVKNHVTVPVNYIVSYKTVIKSTGILDVGTTFGHRLGVVSGTGTLYLERGDMPAGDYDDFFAPDSGTVEFGGNNDYYILSEIAALNNLVLSGTGKRYFPNLDVQLYGNLTIKGATAVDEYDTTISIQKNLIFNSGSFQAKNGTVKFNGNKIQYITGSQSFTGANAFYNLTIDNTYGVQLQQPAELTNHLTFDAGAFKTTQTNILKISNELSDVVSGAGNGNFVDGPLSKKIIGGQSFNFPLGNAGRYGKIILDVDAGTPTDYWIAQYYNHNPGDDSKDPTSLLAPLKYVSHNEYWRVKAPASDNSDVTLRWDCQSGVPASASDRSNYLEMAKWTTSNQWEKVNSSILNDNGQNDGTLKTDNLESFNDFSDGNFYTIASNHLNSYDWTGAVSTNWHDTGNWSDGVIPGSYDDVVIPSSATNMPVISNGDANVKNLDIQSGASLNVKPGHYLDVAGDLTVAGTLTLDAPNGAGNYPSLLTNGAVSVTGTFNEKLYLTANQYHYVSTPINNGNANSDLFCPGNLRPSGRYDRNFYYYDETFDLNGDPNTPPSGSYNSDSLALAWKFANNGKGQPAVDMQIKKGYAFYDETNRLITFTGKPNNGNLDVSDLTFTDNDPVSQSSTLPNFYDGWILLGNPYPSYLNWKAVCKNLTNVDNAIYVWDGNQYASYVNGSKGGSGNLDSTIAPMQAFFIHTTAPNGGFSLNNFARTHATTNFLKKSSQKNDNSKHNYLKLKFNANSFNDYFVVYFNKNATDNFDTKFDAIKLFASNYYSKIPHIYSIDKTLDYSIEALPVEDLNKKELPLGYKIGTAGTYTISVDKFDFDKNENVYLYDKKADKSFKLYPGFSYQFYTQADKIDNRFILKFYKDAAPKINMNIDTTVVEDKKYFIKLPKNAIVDANKSSITVKFLDDNGIEQKWLHYDSEFNGLSLTPSNEQVGNNKIKLVVMNAEKLSSEKWIDIKVINVNDKPQIVRQIPDTTVYTNKYFSINTGKYFKDIDAGDVLTYSIEIKGMQNMPFGLHFDKENGTIYGTPADAQLLVITITATDKSGASVAQTFNLNVKKSIRNIPMVADVSVYPNPSDGVIHIVTDMTVPMTMKVISSDGKMLKQLKILKVQQSVNLTQLPQGNYILEFSNSRQTVRKKLSIY